MVGPIAGALLAVAVAYALRGRGGDETAILSAQGSIEEFLGTDGKSDDVNSHKDKTTT